MIKSRKIWEIWKNVSLFVIIWYQRDQINIENLFDLDIILKILKKSQFNFKMKKYIFIFPIFYTIFFYIFYICTYLILKNFQTIIFFYNSLARESLCIHIFIFKFNVSIFKAITRSKKY